jgi:exopolysaccharide production protein ExoQ
MRSVAPSPHNRVAKPRSARSTAAIAKLAYWTKNNGGQGFATIMVWMIFYIMVVPQGLDYAGLNGVPTSSDALSKIVWMVLLVGSLMLLAQRVTRVTTMLKYINPYLLGFLALALTSYIWSIEPGVTVRRTLRAATVVFVCLAFTVVTWDPKRFQKVLRQLLTTAMVASIIFVVLDPDNARHTLDQPELKDAWHGITMGKNLLGSLASTCILMWLHAWISKESSGFICFVGAATAVLNLAMTRSAASMLATAFAMTFMLMLLRSPNTLKRSMPYLVGLFAATVLTYALAVLNLVPGLDALLKPIAMMTGKDLTFTGRTAIWDIMKEQIVQHPLLGCGYGAYWVGPTPTSPSFQMLTRLYFYPTEGHNGYLDIINDLGWVGCAVLVGYFVAYIKQSLRLMKIDRYTGALCLALIFRGFLADMSESHWFVALSVDYVLMTFVTLNLARYTLHNELYKNALGTVPTRGW